MKMQLLWAVISLTLLSCGAQKPELHHSQHNPLLSASVERVEKGESEGFDVTLKKEALEHLFLFGAAQITTLPAASGTGLAHKLVFFKRQGESLFMFESREGKAASTSVESKILLAEFPVLKEDEQTLTFDFKAGMTKLFIKRGMSTASRNPDDTVLKVTNSYISQAQTRGEVFFIDQIVRVDTETSNTSLHMKYTLRSYQPNPNFSPKESSAMEKVGHFEIHPTVESTTGKSTSRLMKFDTSKPVVFHLSKNIPKKHRDAVIKGVLYWNKAFDKEVIQVQDLPESVSVHEPGYHILQWLDWDSAGFAYADMTGDPLTGEILQAHVYMTSTFAVSSLKSARQVYRRYLAQQRRDPKEAHFEVLLGLKGFEEASTCLRPFHPSLAKDMAQMIQLVSEKGLDENEDQPEIEKIFLRLANDYITEVVAHEIGHTLGLRHNFAASMMSSLNEETYPHISRAYFFTGDLPQSVTPGGSVMDYVPLLSGAMIGAHIRHDRGILPYDQEAMKYAYTDAKIEDIKAYPFCSDEDRSKGILLDCQIWDMTAKPLVEAKSNVKNALELRGEILALSLADSEDPQTLSLESMKKARLTPEQDAQKIMSEQYQLLTKMSSSEAQFVTVRSAYPHQLSLRDQIDYQNETKKYQRQEIEKWGGLGPFLLSSLSFQEHGSLQAMESFYQHFEQTLNRLYPDASEEVRTLARENAKLYWEIFQAELIRSIPVAFSPTLQFSFVDNSWFHSLDQIMTKALFSVGPQVISTNPEREKVYQWALPNQTLTGKSGVRENLTSLVLNDFQKTSPSYKRKLRSVTEELKAQFLLWEKSVLGPTQDEDLLNDQLFDLLTHERRLFRQLP